MDEDFFGAVTKEAHRQAKRADERMGFLIREGVTFPGIEIIWGNRLMRVDPKKLEYNRALKTVGTFAEYCIRTLRSKPMIPPQLNLYRVQDLWREEFFLLTRILKAALPEGEFAQLEKRVAAEVKRQKGDEAISDAALFAVSVQALEMEVFKLLSERRQRKAKEERHG